MGQRFEKILNRRRKMDDKYSNGWCSLLLGKWKLEIQWDNMIYILEWLKLNTDHFKLMRR